MKVFYILPNSTSEDEGLRSSTQSPDSNSVSLIVVPNFMSSFWVIHGTFVCVCAQPHSGHI